MQKIVTTTRKKKWKLKIEIYSKWYHLLLIVVIMGPPSLMYFQYNQNQIRIVFIAKKMERKIHTYTGETGGKFTYYRSSGQKSALKKVKHQ